MKITFVLHYLTQQTSVSEWFNPQNHTLFIGAFIFFHTFFLSVSHWFSFSSSYYKTLLKPSCRDVSVATWLGNPSQ